MGLFISFLYGLGSFALLIMGVAFDNVTLSVGGTALMILTVFEEYKYLRWNK